MSARSSLGGFRPLVFFAGWLGKSCAVTCGVALAGSAWAWDPPGWRKPPAREESLVTNPASLLPLWGVGFFRTFVSPVDGDRCPSYPTCSAYALQAVGEHGFVLGVLLTAGRLVAESDEAAFAPRIRVGGQWKVYSPVEADLAFLGRGLEP